MATIRTAPTTGARGFARFISRSDLRHSSQTRHSHAVASKGTVFVTVPFLFG
jgi:hypothetical protein